MRPSILAAEGWIELGNFEEAAEELHNCPHEIKSSPQWVKLWVCVYAATNRWREVEMMCGTLAEIAPDDPFTIKHQAEAFHKQGHSREAFAAFQYAPLSFKQGPEYFYALARYLCGMDQMTLALSFLGEAFDADPLLKMKALNDPELKRVWLDLQEG